MTPYLPNRLPWMITLLPFDFALNMPRYTLLRKALGTNVTFAPFALSSTRSGRIEGLRRQKP